MEHFKNYMANPDQKTILIDNAFEEIKHICKNLQKDTDASNLEVQSLLKLIMNEWEEINEDKKFLDLGKLCTEDISPDNISLG